MQPQTQAEIFIKTLKDMLVAERKIARARLRSQQKAAAESYMRAFRAEFDQGRAHREARSRRNGLGSLVGDQARSD